VATNTVRGKDHGPGRGPTSQAISSNSGCGRTARVRTWRCLARRRRACQATASH
jgi:hypothetical protein